MFALEIYSDEEDKVQFYSVRELGSEYCETDFFLKRIIKDATFKKEVGELMTFVFDTIGNEQGAKEYFFNRLERIATAMPPKKDGKVIGLAKANEFSFNIFNFKIRLYCLRLSDSVVVLFGGGIKLSKGRAQDDKGVSMQFNNANRYAQKILDSINDGTICVKYKSVVGLDGKNNNIIF